MLNINKVVVAGHVGSVEIRYTSSGDAVLNLSIATNRRWTDKDGNKSEAVEWHRVVVFGKLAELVKDWVKKGTQVYVYSACSQLLLMFLYCGISKSSGTCAAALLLSASSTFGGSFTSCSFLSITWGAINWFWLFCCQGSCSTHRQKPTNRRYY
jgi:hypothetical protein